MLVWRLADDPDRRASMTGIDTTTTCAGEARSFVHAGERRVQLSRTRDRANAPADGMAIVGRVRLGRLACLTSLVPHGCGIARY